MKNQLLKAFWAGVVVLFSGLSAELRRFAKAGLSITRNILEITKDIVNNPTCEAILSAALPETISNEIPHIKTILSQSIEALGGLTVDNNPFDENETICQFVKQLSEVPELHRNALLQKLAAVITAKLDSNGHPENYYQSLTDALMHYRKTATLED